MDSREMRKELLETLAWAPYERIKNPGRADWQDAYDALTELAKLYPEDGRYPNTLGYICFYGRNTGKRNYREARKWFEKGAALNVIESTYKLADMLAEGLGGPADPVRALYMYVQMYLFCRIEFEGGRKDSKFADTALRMGRVYHEGKILEKNDMQALGYLLEAKYAIDWRKQYGEYGDDTVERNILRLIADCEQPDGKERQREQFGLSLGRVPNYLMPCDEVRMTIGIDVDEKGVARLEFRRQRKDGKKPNRILWSVSPAMRCFMTDRVVLYGADIREIWNKNPGETVVCDRYEYVPEKDEYQFFLNDELQCRLREGNYVLPMNEFWKDEIDDGPSADGEMMQ